MFGYETKLDRYFRRSEEELRLQREELQDHREEFRVYSAESRAREQRRDAGQEEARIFNRELLLRNEKAFDGMVKRLEELGEMTRSNTEETKAQTQALLRVIDRMDAQWGKPPEAE